MMEIDTTFRSEADERMDDFMLGGKELEDALDKIAKINKWLGGNKITVNGVSKILQNSPNGQPLTIYDLGCGNGDMLRTLSRYAAHNGHDIKFVGVDANQNTIDFARKLSVDFPKISYLSQDIFDESLCDLPMDIALFTLTLHHFKNEQIAEILKRFAKNVRLGIVVNDLERSALAYRLFQVMAKITNLSEMPSKDGLVSILRGFKKPELEAFSKDLNIKNFLIRWKWAFRYQWIIYKS